MTRAERAQARVAAKAEEQAREERLKNGQATSGDLEFQASYVDEEMSVLGEILATREAGATPEILADPQFITEVQILQKTIRQLREIADRIRQKAARLRLREEKARLRQQKAERKKQVSNTTTPEQAGGL